MVKCTFVSCRRAYWVECGSSLRKPRPEVRKFIHVCIAENGLRLVQKPRGAWTPNSAWRTIKNGTIASSEADLPDSEDALMLLRVATPLVREGSRVQSSPAHLCEARPFSH